MAVKRVSKKKVRSPVFKAKMKKGMHDWKAGEMHSGSKQGPVVTKRSQAIAISLSQARKAVAGKRSKKAAKQK